MQTSTYTDYVNYLLSLGYDSSVEFLKNKYGLAKMPYFEETSYHSFMAGKLPAPIKNRVTRTREGLYCHHVREDEGILLSTPRAIKLKNYPYEWQLPNELVYCTMLEHLVLHALISIENRDKNDMRLGIGGYVNFLRPEMIEWIIQEKVPTIPWKRNCYNVLSDLSKSEFQTILLQLDRLLIKNKVTSNVELSRALLNWLENENTDMETIDEMITKTSKGR